MKRVAASVAAQQVVEGCVEFVILVIVAAAAGQRGLDLSDALGDTSEARVGGAHLLEEGERFVQLT